MSFDPSEIGSTPKPSASILKREFNSLSDYEKQWSGWPLFHSDQDQKRENNNNWKGGVGDDMTQYRKNWTKKNPNYQTEYHRMRRAKFIAQGLRFDGRPRRTSI
jgi:hypothetical protein|tara:strand:- start:81 stop:392 length:312 start_codon:yes stop_codon:yes gene_type:complete